MQIPLGDRLFDAIVTIFIAAWAIGWVVVLVVMALQHVLPKHAAPLEQSLQRFGQMLGPILKYTGIAALVLLALRLVASWLGWAPPIPASDDPGDYSPRG